MLGAALAAVEVFLAKLRLFRVPELLAGSFVLALLAVTAVLPRGCRASRCPRSLYVQLLSLAAAPCC